MTEDNIKMLSNELTDAEEILRRDNKISDALKQYNKVCKIYEELNDFETASYFYGRCLEISRENKEFAGECDALKGLGICEEKVLNIFESMKYLENALELSIDRGLKKNETQISQELVRVYKNIAMDF